jgi:hypothetical protein
LIRAGFLVVAALLACGPAAAEESPLALEGRGLRELAAHPLVALPLRSVSQGRSRAVFERLNLPGPPVAVAEGRFVHTRGCAESCARDGIFLGFDSVTERLYLLLVESGRPVLAVPPFGTAWPAALREGVTPFLPAPPPR